MSIFGTLLRTTGFFKGQRTCLCNRDPLLKTFHKLHLTFVFPDANTFALLHVTVNKAQALAATANLALHVPLRRRRRPLVVVTTRTAAAATVAVGVTTRHHCLAPQSRRLAVLLAAGRHRNAV